MQILYRLSQASEIGFFIAFFAGIISFFSPCILPLVPAYFSFLLGSSAERAGRKKEILVSVAFFCLGFTVFFVLLGTSATGIGRFLAFHLKYFRIFAGLLILFFSLELLELTHFFSTHKGFSFEFRKKPEGFGSILFGAALAVSWTPCVGPVLGAILTMASTQETVLKGMIMLFFYSTGLALPFIIFAFFLSSLRKFQKMMNVHARKVRIFAGVVLLFFAFYLLSGG